MLGQCEEFRQSLEKMLGHDREFADPSSKAAAAEDSGSDSGCLDLGADSGDDVDVGGPKSAAVAEQELVAWRFSGQTVHINRVTDVPGAVDAALLGCFVFYHYNASYGWVAGKVVKVGKVGKANCNVEVKWADGDTGRHNFSCSEYAGASIEDVQLGECEPGTWYIAEVLVVDEQAEGGSGEGEEEEEEAEEEEEEDGEETAPASRAVSGVRARAAQRG